MESPRVALCLFGLVGGSSGKNGAGDPVDPAISFSAYYDHILSKNDVDVYFHTWSVDHGEKLLRMYNPKKYIIEPQVVFDDDVVVNRTNSRWYSTRKSIDLIDGGYDIVMLSRFDVAFFTDIDFSQYDPKHFYVSHWNDVGHKNHHTHGFLDLWFFGGQNIMRKFGQLSLYMDSYHISQHVSSMQHAKHIGADVKHVMYRGYDFELARRAILKCKK